ncbi:MAG TPA: BTAD domain-containing putative transcriptional regulator [Gemmatimonadaceae bacterium]|nr:BTAD domain-containing putative transcriptional regulator [Gemmatimonadaceae bacterium]
MIRDRYAMLFSLGIVVLTTGAAYAYSQLGATPKRTMLVLPPSSGEPVRVGVDRAIAPSAEDYRRFAGEDAAWRRKHARFLTTDEYRARGDWRTPERQALDDRVFALTKRGENAKAIAELERWVANHPRDAEALLDLARLTNQIGRNDESIRWYREVLALKERGR